MALTHGQKQCASLQAHGSNQDAWDSTDRVNPTGTQANSTVRGELGHLNAQQGHPTRHDSLRTAQDQGQSNASKPLIESVKIPVAAPFAPPPKMDFSQQTPTQINDDRDYTEYCDIVPSSPINGETQPESHERTFQDNDTGAVNFGNLSEFGRPSSQISEDAGFENTRGDWRLPDGTSQLNSSHTPYRPQGAATFETPAVPRNPFAAKPSIGAPLAGSQLFGQTQFSSAIKRISPTSSRPSPNLFHHSVSPNIIETSPLKNRANVSSPTDIHTSSPQRLHEIPHTSLRDKDGEAMCAETPLINRSTGGDMIPESPPSSDHTPRANLPRSSGTNGPIAHYEPMKKSQERKSSDGHMLLALESDSDTDDATKRMERKKKIERKRAKAAEEIGRVSFTPRLKELEQPARKKRKVSLIFDKAEVGVGIPAVLDQELPPLVGDFQKGLVASNETQPVESTKATPGNSAPENQQAQKGNVAAHLVDLADEERGTNMEDRIPATSPVSSMPPTAPCDNPTPAEPELPKLVIGDEAHETVTEDSEPSSLPPMRRRNLRTYGRGLRQKRRNPFISSSNSDTLEENTPNFKPASSPLRRVDVADTPEQTKETDPEPLHEPIDISANNTPQPKKAGQSLYPDLPPPMTTRSRGKASSPVTPMANQSLASVAPTSSSLSILSNTPVPSAKTTPGTQESPVSDRLGSVNLPSPVGSHNLRQGGSRAGTNSVSPQQLTRAVRAAKRFPRLDSESTDELHHSPTASVLERSMVNMRSSRPFRQSLPPVQRAHQLFEGMVFALSFRDKTKQHERTKLEAKITQAGGTILGEGFQDMFEHPSIMNTANPVIDEGDALKLTKTGQGSGFTALIADSHSRKAKYMQALALGLPCLAHQWITTCLNKGGIVDWEPYMLCAGASAVLGNAIRSRAVATYCATEARLVNTISQRPRLLHGQRVLVVVDSKKSRNDAKEPYIFLVTALGPSVSRVFNTEQARQALLEHEKNGNPFEWLYIDKGTGTADAVLAPTQQATGSRKRKKKTSTIQQTMGDIRILDDELVIQSLILGRMVEEEEMHF